MRESGAPRQVVPLAAGEDPFARLAPPTLPAEPVDTSEVLRLGPVPPPRPGEVAMPFPPPEAAPPPSTVTLTAPPLEVLRTQPEGDVKLVGAVTATFNQPMVPLASVDALQAKDVPLRLEPQPAGKFRWLDTSTIAFEAEGRLPFATEYRATVPAGTKSALGQLLPSDVTWTLTTPRPALVEARPHTDSTSVPTDTLLLLRFNARIDPQKVLRQATFGSDYQRVELELVPWGAGNELPLGWEADRSVALRPKTPLETATEHRFGLPAGFTSEEGPLPTREALTTRFRTYEPLQVESVECGWHVFKGRCDPSWPVNIQFNNPLAKDQDFSRLISFSPTVADPHFESFSHGVMAHAPFAASTTYTVRISGRVKDVFGQTLGKDVTRKVTFGELEPRVELGGGERLGVLEAKLGPTLPVIAVNATRGHLRAASLTDDQLYDAIHRLTRGDDRKDDPFRGLKLAIDRQVTLGRRNEANRVSLDLGEAMRAGGRGLALVELDVPALRRKDTEWETGKRNALVQVTDLGVMAALSDDEIRVLVTTLSEASLARNVRLELRGPKGVLAEASTDASGLAALPGPHRLGTKGPLLLLASSGDDRAFLWLDGSITAGAWMSSFSEYRGWNPDSFLVGQAFTERGVYRPGETAHVQLIARRRTVGPQGRLEPLSSSTLDVRIQNARGAEVLTRSVELSPFGTATLDVPIAKDAPLGTWSISATSSGDPYPISASFDVREYRTPEYRVGVKHLGDASRLVHGSTEEFEVEGAYFFGAPMSGAKVSWHLYRQKANFVPPGQEEFNVGEPQVWWGRGGFGRASRQSVRTGEGVLDARGRLVVPLQLSPGESAHEPVTFTLEAEVEDRNRQRIAANASVLSHASLRYVGIRMDRGVVRAGEKARVEAIVAGVDGRREKGVRIRFELIEDRSRGPIPLARPTADGQAPTETEPPVSTCEATSGEAPVSCELAVPKGGRWKLVAKVKDADGRPNASSLFVWSVGENEPLWREGEPMRVDLIPDKRSYAPGETARVLVNSPLSSARGLLILSREGFVETRPIEVKNGSLLLDIPLKEEWIPSLSVAVALASGRTKAPDTEHDAGRPRVLWAETTLEIERDARRIALAIEPSSTRVAPGDELSISLQATDAKGQPVQANVALMVVDEGVLSLTSYQTPNPLEALYQPVPPQTAMSDGRGMLVPRDAPIEVGHGGLGGQGTHMKIGGIGGQGRGLGGAAKQRMDFAVAESAPASMPGEPEFQVRSLFASTAFFDGSLRTDADGRVEARVKMPDNLTQFRVMAVAVDRERLFGSADTQVTVRQPLIVRPSLPRFLNVGDRFEAAAVVNNETGLDTEVEVQLRAANATVEQSRKRISIRAGGAKEVRFQASAGEPGPAKFQFAAVALTQARPTDAAEVTLPTLVPATAEAFATYGTTETAVRQPLEPPTDALPGFGGLDVQLSSTALTGLQDAVRFLVDYPFECVEQTASRLIPLVALADVLQEFPIASDLDEERRKQLVASALDRIVRQQLPDGGFAMWPGSPRAWQYVSAWVMNALWVAQEAGVKVDPSVMARGRRFLVNRLEKPADDWEKRDYASQAMAVLVLSRMGQTPVAHLLSLTARDDLPLFARAWLLEAWHLSRRGDAARPMGAILQQIRNAASESAGAIHFAEHRSEALRVLMHSNDRTDAIILGTLLTVAPRDPMVEKLQRGLMQARVQGRWSTTQANAYALLAMRDYFRLYESERPAFDARAWVDDTYVAGRRFEGREMTIARTTVPIDALQKTPGDLVLAKDGPGRLYYRVGLRYAPKDLQLAPAQQGFVVTRSYSGVHDAKAVRRDADGTWRVQAGALVRVRVQLTVPDRAHYVALVDPMPAGFEAVDPALATTAKAPLPEEQSIVPASMRWWHWSPWTHTELRDDRAQAFADRMSAGVYEHTYLVRATAPGSFIVPPTRAEEMYAPETFGRTASDRVVIEAP